MALAPVPMIELLSLLNRFVRNLCRNFGTDNRQSSSQDEAAIRDMVESRTAAVRRRDFEGVLQKHSSDIAMFDVPPPFQSTGIEAYIRRCPYTDMLRDQMENWAG